MLMGTCTYQAVNDLDITEITITKVWNDGGKADSRPTPLTFMEGLRLYQNGEYLDHGAITLEETSADGKSYTFSGSNHPNIRVKLVMDDNNTWTVTYDHLPKRDAEGNELVWTVQESLHGYEVTYGTDNPMEITNKPIREISSGKIMRMMKRNAPHL